VPFNLVIGQIYHVDPENIHGMIPEEKLKKLENKILIWNAYKGDIQIWTSDNTTKWDTTVVNGKNGILYKGQKKYVKIPTGKVVVHEYVLIENKAYLIFWDREKKIWTIKLYVK